jgi:glycosyltransferase involved in cell wall biosynthesis
MIPLHVLHLNTYGGIGGAFIAADRLHQGLLQAEISSVLAYRHLADSENTLLPYPRYYRIEHQHGQRVENLIGSVCQYIGLNDIGNFLAYFLPRNPFFRQASIVNLHNLHGEYFSYLALPRLTHIKPTVWTLHDMWSFTGHCAYSYECQKWQTGCGNCPHPGSYPPVKRDATRLEWRLKQRAYQQGKLHIVTPSQWLTNQVKSSMLSDFPIHYIPNGLDTACYHPLDSEHCRHILGLPHTKKVILFSAKSLADVRKGGNLLIHALRKLPESLKNDIILLTFGEGQRGMTEEIGISHYHLGYLTYEPLKVLAYSAADLYIFPTRADNLPIVLQESMACGTPMVSFDVGGVSDLVRPGITGYLARAESSRDFCQGIVELLEDETLRLRMRKNCRKIAEKEYSLELQVQRYLELYRDIHTLGEP